MTDMKMTMNEHVKERAIKAINEQKNIIICGPEMSGKTTLQKELKELLQKNDYNIFYGVQEYHYRDRSKKIYKEKKFWIELIDEDLLSNIKEDYEYIETRRVCV